MSVDLQVDGTNITNSAKYIKAEGGDDSELSISKINIGVGTSSPDQKLEVDGVVRIRSSLGVNYLEIGAYNTNTDNFGYVSSGGQDDGTGLKFETTDGSGGGYATRATILNDGNFGIGTVNPSEKLEVDGNIKADKFIGPASAPLVLETQNNDNININSDGDINASPEGDFFVHLKNSAFRVDDVTNPTTINIMDVDISGQVQIGPDLATPANQTAALAVMSGRVGIGTEQPGANLEVSIGAASGPILIARANSQERFRISADGADSALESLFQNNLTLGTATSNTSITILDANGHVGIGTPDPQALLEVSESVVGPGLPLPNNLAGIGGQINIANPNNSINAGAALIFRSLGQVIGEYNSAMIRTYHVDGADMAWRDNLAISNMQNGTLIDALTINSDGNVGIISTNPAGTLDVNSSIIVVEPPTGDPAIDRPNIQRAIDALALNPPTMGGTVILQNGIPYVVDQAPGGQWAILVPDGVHLCGSSMQSSQIEVADNQNDISVLRVENPVGENVTVVIKDLLINGREEAGTPNRPAGITAIDVNAPTTDNSPQPVLVQNVHIGQCTTGIKVESWWSEIHNCYINNCVTGIDLNYDTVPGDDTNASTILHTYIWGSDTAIFINGICNQVIGCNIGDITAGGIGIDINAETGVANYIAGNYIEAQLANVTGVHVNSEGNTITGNYFDIHGAGSVAIEIEPGQERGNTVFSNFWRNPPTVTNPIANQLNSNLILTDDSDNADNFWLRHDNSTNGRNMQVNWFAREATSNDYDYMAGIGIIEDDHTDNAFISTMNLRVRDGGTGLVTALSINGGTPGAYVGIGTTNPDAKLEVAITVATPPEDPGIYFNRTNALVSDMVSEAGVYIKDNSANFPLHIADHNENPLFTVKGDGNVGIGETAPQDKMEVNGAVLIKDKLKLTQDDGDEYLDSSADGVTDLNATDSINLRIGGTPKVSITTSETTLAGDLIFGSEGIKFTNSNSGPSGGADGDMHLEVSGTNTTLYIKRGSDWKELAFS